MPWGKMGTIWSEIGLDTSPLAQGVARSKALMQDADRTLTSRAQAISRSLGSIGAALSIGVTTPLTVLGNTLKNTSMQFETAMANVWTIVDDGREAIAAMGKEVEALSFELPQTATQLADGLYQVISAAIPAADAMGVLEVSARAASAGLADTFTSVDAITSVLNAYGMAAEEAGRVSDIMFKTVERGKVTFPELAQNLGDVVSTAATAGVSFEELGGALATLTKVGVRAPEAVTALNQAILTFIDPSDEAAKLAKQLGIEFSAASLASKGLYGSLQEVYEATGGNIEVLSALFPNVRALKGVLGLLRQDMGLFKGDLDAMRGSLGATEKAFEKQAQTGARATQIFKNQLSALAKTFGDELVPMLVSAMEQVKPLVEAFRELPEPLKQTIVQFGVLAAASGPVMLALKGLLALLSGPVGIVVGAVAATGAIVGLVRVLSDVQGRAERAAKAAEAHADSLRDQRTRAQELIEKIQALTNEKETLRKKTELTRDEEKRLAEIQTDLKKLSNELASILPQVASGYDAEGNAVIDLNKALRELVTLRQQENTERAKSAATYVSAKRTELDALRRELADLEAEAQDRIAGARMAAEREAAAMIAGGMSEAEARERAGRGPAILEAQYNAMLRELRAKIEAAEKELYVLVQRYRAVGQQFETGKEPVTIKTVGGSEKVVAPTGTGAGTAPPEPTEWELWLAKVRSLSAKSYGVLREAFDGIAENLKSGDVVLRTEAEQRMSAILSFLGNAVVEYGGDWEGKIAPALSEYVKRGYKTMADVVKEEAERLQKALEASQKRLQLIRAGMLDPDSIAAFKMLDEQSVANYLKDKADEIAALVENNREYLDTVLRGEARPRSWAEVKLWDYATAEEGIKAGQQVLKRLTDKELQELDRQILRSQLKVEAILTGKAAVGPEDFGLLKMLDEQGIQEGLEAGRAALTKLTDDELKELERQLIRARLKVEAILAGKAPVGPQDLGILKMLDEQGIREGVEAGKQALEKLTDKELKELERQVVRSKLKVEAILAGQAPVPPQDLGILRMLDEQGIQEGVEAGKKALEKLTDDELKEIERQLTLARLKTEAILSGTAPVGPQDLGFLKMLDEKSIQEGVEAGKRLVAALEQYDRDLFEFRRRTGQVTFEEELGRLQAIADATATTNEERLAQAQTYYDTVSDLIAGATEEELEALETVLEASLETYLAMGESGAEMAIAIQAALDEIRRKGEETFDALRDRIADTIGNWIEDLVTGTKTFNAILKDIGRSILRFFIDIVAKQIASSIASSVATATKAIQGFGQQAGGILNNVIGALGGLGPGGWVVAGLAAVATLATVFGPKAPEVTYNPVEGYTPGTEETTQRTVTRQAVAPVSVVFTAGAIQIVNPNRIEDIVDQVGKALAKRLEDEDILFGVGPA